METLVTAMASIPSLTDDNWYDSSSTDTPMMESIALYTASTGPVPVDATYRSTMSGPINFTVAVGMPDIPVETCKPVSFHKELVFPAWSRTNASRSSSSSPPFFFSATCLKRSKTAFNFSTSRSYPSSLRRVPTAFRPECLPRTIPAPDCASPRIRPILSGDMISYVLLFLIIPSWWIPDSCWNALAPTMALCGWQIIPVYSETSFEAGVIWTGLTEVYNLPEPWLPSKCVLPFRAKDMTISSNEAFPARSPIPLMVHSS
mmetsp:Transcript_6387/g.16171  ORF Transcript_6387/g.16171 Transcript_6387/m.16171 type:complete len:260 (-) Transcript_6387:1062-1841(-)